MKVFQTRMLGMTHVAVFAMILLNIIGQNCLRGIRIGRRKIEVIHKGKRLRDLVVLDSLITPHDLENLNAFVKPKLLEDSKDEGIMLQKNGIEDFRPLDVSIDTDEDPSDDQQYDNGIGDRNGDYDLKDMPEYNLETKADFKGNQEAIDWMMKEPNEYNVKSYEDSSVLQDADNFSQNKYFTHKENQDEVALHHRKSGNRIHHGTSMKDIGIQNNDQDSDGTQSLSNEINIKSSRHHHRKTKGWKDKFDDGGNSEYSDNDHVGNGQRSWDNFGDDFHGGFNNARYSDNNKDTEDNFEQSPRETTMKNLNFRIKNQDATLFKQLENFQNIDNIGNVDSDNILGSLDEPRNEFGNLRDKYEGMENLDDESYSNDDDKIVNSNERKADDKQENDDRESENESESESDSKSQNTHASDHFESKSGDKDIVDFDNDKEEDETNDKDEEENTPTGDIDTDQSKSNYPNDDDILRKINDDNDDETDDKDEEENMKTNDNGSNQGISNIKYADSDDSDDKSKKLKDDNDNDETEFIDKHKPLNQKIHSKTNKVNKSNKNQEEKISSESKGTQVTINKEKEDISNKLLQNEKQLSKGNVGHEDGIIATSFDAESGKHRNNEQEDLSNSKPLQETTIGSKIENEKLIPTDKDEHNEQIITAFSPAESGKNPSNKQADLGNNKILQETTISSKGENEHIPTDKVLQGEQTTSVFSHAENGKHSTNTATTIQHSNSHAHQASVSIPKYNALDHKNINAADKPLVSTEKVETHDNDEKYLQQQLIQELNELKIKMEHSSEKKPHVAFKRPQHHKGSNVNSPTTTGFRRNQPNYGPSSPPIYSAADLQMMKSIVSYLRGTPTTRSLTTKTSIDSPSESFSLKSLYYYPIHPTPQEQTDSTPETKDPRFSEWNDWSTCSVTCGKGTSMRARVCLVTTCPQEDLFETKNCQKNTCPDPRFSEWNDWSRCSVTCGRGTSVRGRVCLITSCPQEDLFETKRCQKSICADDLERESLEEHNKLRAKHSSPPLLWSYSLERKAHKIAQSLAAKDFLTLDDLQEPQGESIAQIKYTDENMARKAIDKWYSEIKSYSFSYPKISETTRHFLQIVWRGTKEMGLAVVKSPSGDYAFVVALYSPTIDSSKGRLRQNVFRPGVKNDLYATFRKRRSTK